MRERWLVALKRAVLAVLLVLILTHVPLPAQTPGWAAFVEIPLLVFLLVCYLGKVLYDTLFYNRLP